MSPVLEAVVIGYQDKTFQAFVLDAASNPIFWVEIENWRGPGGRQVVGGERFQIAGASLRWLDEPYWRQEAIEALRAQAINIQRISGKSIPILRGI